jgi:hypothetical protein
MIFQNIDVIYNAFARNQAHAILLNLRHPLVCQINLLEIRTELGKNKADLAGDREDVAGRAIPG